MASFKIPSLNTTSLCSLPAAATDPATAADTAPNSAFASKKSASSSSIEWTSSSCVTRRLFWSVPTKETMICHDRLRIKVTKTGEILPSFPASHL